ALLGVGDLPPRGLPQGDGADAAGHPRGRVHPLADPVLHRAAGGGDGVAVGHRHERTVLPRWRAGAGRGVPLARLAADGPARRAVRDGGVQVLDRVLDGALRVPAGRPLAAAADGAGGGVRASARRLTTQVGWSSQLSGAARRRLCYSNSVCTTGADSLASNATIVGSTG